MLSTIKVLVLCGGVTAYLYPPQSIHHRARSFARKVDTSHKRKFTNLQMALEDDGGDFFSSSDDDNTSKGSGSSSGGFFEEVEKQPQQPPPSAQKEEEEPMTLEELEMLATPFDEHLPKINTVTLVGRVGNAPEPRYFDDGKVVLNLSLAVKRKYHSLERKVRNIRSGEEETDWFPLEFWGRDAEYVTNYVEKGSRLGITGSLTQDGWVDKTTGEQRRKPKIIVRHIDILESRAEAELRKSNKGSYSPGGGGSYDGDSNSRKSSYDEDEDSMSPGKSALVLFHLVNSCVHIKTRRFGYLIWPLLAFV